MCEFVIVESLRSLQEIYDHWNAMFQAWLNNLLSSPISENWHDEVARFVAETESLGLEISPDSIRAIEAIIESRIASSGRFAADGPSVGALAREIEPPHVVSIVPEVSGPSQPHDQPAQVKPVGDPSREFSARLKSARASFEVLRQLLESAGEKLDALKIGEEADIDYEVEKIPWSTSGRYNDDLEAARDLWLRYDLFADDVARLNEMLTPASLGLPMFADEEQAARASQQIGEIGQRLRGRLAVWDSTITTMQVTETVGDVAGVLAGAGAVSQCGQGLGGTGGRLSRRSRPCAAAYGADYLAEKGLRAAGAGDQSIRGARLAAAVGNHP